MIQNHHLEERLILKKLNKVHLQDQILQEKILNNLNNLIQNNLENLKFQLQAFLINLKIQKNKDY